MLKLAKPLDDVNWHLREMNWHAAVHIALQKLTQRKQFCMYKIDAK